MKTIQSTFIGLVIAVVLLGAFVGCSEDSATSPINPGYSPEAMFADGEQITILKLDPAQVEHFLAIEDQENVNVEQKIKAQVGGEIVIGGPGLNLVHLIFPEGSLAQDTTIQIVWEASGSPSGMLASFSFTPHGLNFDQPVEVVFSYAAADLNGVDEDSLQVYYFNEETGVWELIGGVVDKEAKTVRVKLHHFSRYSLSHSYR